MRSLMLALVPFAACTGSITEPPTRAPETWPQPQSPLAPFAPAPAGLKRLTQSQYVDSVRQVFAGVDVHVPPLEPDTLAYHYASIGASDSSIGPAAADQYDAAAVSVAAQVAPWAVQQSCGADLSACAPAFVKHWGRLLWRRSLDDDEVQRLSALAGTTSEGFTHALEAMLESPFFLYRVELGESGAYTGLELASRLSFFLWGTTPDEALLDAAERGDLQSDDGLRAQVDRLLSASRARTSLKTFFSQHFSLDRLDGLQKPAFAVSTPTLGDAMRGELERVIDDVVFEQKADMRHLFDSDATFVNPELAAFYGYPAVTDWTKVTRPSGGEPRLGMLGTAGFLTMQSGQTSSSPTLRGKFIKVSVLCEEIGSPPPGVVTQLPPPQPGETTRQRSERHQTDPLCASCHGQMDPLGYPLESFDAVGAFRTTDNGQSVDTRSVIGGVEVDGPRALAGFLATSPKVGRCFARELYRYATGHLNLEGEDVVLLGVSQELEAAGFRFDALPRSIVLSDGFRKAGPPQ